jgi:hypothetical protein
MIVSARGGPAWKSPADSSRWSDPSSRIVCGEGSSSGFPLSDLVAPLSSLKRWIWDEIAKARKLIRIQTPIGIRIQRSQRRFSDGSFGADGGRSPGRRRSRSFWRSGERSLSRRPGRDL